MQRKHVGTSGIVLERKERTRNQKETPIKEKQHKDKNTSGYVLDTSCQEVAGKGETRTYPIPRLPGRGETPERKVSSTGGYEAQGAMSAVERRWLKPKNE